MSGGILSNFLGGAIGGDQANMGTGILGSMNNYMTNNAGTLLGFGAGMLAGDNALAAQGAMQGMQQDQRTRLIQRKEAEEEQRKVEAVKLAQQYNLPPAFASDPDSVFGMVKSIEMQKRTPKERSLEEQWLLRQPEEVQNQIFSRKALGGSNEYGTTPIWGTDAQGNPTVLQLGKNGTVAQPQLPEGVKIARDPIKVDGPTGVTLLDPQTRQQIGFIPKDNAGAARSTEIGKAEGAAIAGAGAQASAADDALNITKQIREHPRLNAAVGSMDGRGPVIRGDTQAFVDLVDQAKSGAFLTAVQSLKGLGAMSEYEAKSATSAINRMNRATDEQSFLKAVSDYETVIARAKQKAQALQGRGGQAPPPSGGTTGKTKSGVSWSAQ